MKIEFVPAKARHEEIANDRVVFMDLYFEERFFSVESDVDEVIFVDQDPLQGGGELPVIVHDEDGFEGSRMNGFVEGRRVLWFFCHAMSACVAVTISHRA